MVLRSHFTRVKSVIKNVIKSAEFKTLRSKDRDKYVIQSVANDKLLVSKNVDKFGMMLSKKNYEKNGFFKTQPQTFENLQFMAVMYGSLIVGRHTEIRIENATKESQNCAGNYVNLPLTLSGINNHNNQMTLLDNRVGVLIKEEERKQMVDLFKGYLEVIRLNERKNYHDQRSIFYSWYYYVLNYIKRIAFKKISPWMTEEQGYRIVQKEHEYREKMFYKTMSLLGLNQASVEKLLQLGYNFVDRSFLNLSPIEKAYYLGRLYKIMETHLRETEGVEFSPAVIVLRLISVLMVMTGCQTEESKAVLEWSKTFIHLQSVETWVFLLLFHIISILNVLYRRNGKSMKNLIDDFDLALRRTNRTNGTRK